MKRRMETWTIIAFAVCRVIGVSASRAEANTTISGTGPFTITDDTKLVGDVDCSAVTGLPCIKFAAPHLQLDLNGFTIKGPKPTPCNDQSGPIGIDTNGQEQAVIEGPGKVEKFLQGIFVRNGSNYSRVRKVVAIRNCSIGILVGANKVEIRDNIVLNTFNLLFGTIAITISGNDNDVEEHEVHGNKNTGIAVGGTGNHIKRNSVATNATGINLLAGSSNNTVDQNLVLYHPSFDITDGGVGNTVTQQNVCETGRGGAAATVCAISPTRPFEIDHEVGNP